MTDSGTTATDLMLPVYDWQALRVLIADGRASFRRRQSLLRAEWIGVGADAELLAEPVIERFSYRELMGGVDDDDRMTIVHRVR